MKRTINIGGILLVAVGVVWFLQGIGILHGSSMTDQTEWAVIGAIVIVIGGGLLVYMNRRQPQP